MYMTGLIIIVTYGTTVWLAYNLGFMNGHKYGLSESIEIMKAIEKNLSKCVDIVEKLEDKK